MESRAKVIKSSPELKATVITPPHQDRPLAFVRTDSSPRERSGDILLNLPDDPDSFIKFCREYLKVTTDHGLFGDEMQKFAEGNGLTPIAFHKPDEMEHWTLVAGITPEVATLYDPTTGVRQIPTSRVDRIDYTSGENKRFTFLRGINMDVALEKFQADNYKFNLELLEQLGPTQTDPVNCGPLVLYAAKVGKIREL